jgi:hypothetical protein
MNADTPEERPGRRPNRFERAAADQARRAANPEPARASLKKALLLAIAGLAFVVFGPGHHRVVPYVGPPVVLGLVVLQFYEDIAADARRASLLWLPMVAIAAPPLLWEEGVAPAICLAVGLTCVALSVGQYLRTSSTWSAR